MCLCTRVYLLLLQCGGVWRYESHRLYSSIVVPQSAPALLHIPRIQAHNFPAHEHTNSLIVYLFILTHTNTTHTHTHTHTHEYTTRVSSPGWRPPAPQAPRLRGPREEEQAAPRPSGVHPGGRRRRRPRISGRLRCTGVGTRRRCFRRISRARAACPRRGCRGSSHSRKNVSTRPTRSTVYSAVLVSPMNDSSYTRTALELH